MLNSAQMILMGVSNDQSDQILAPLGDECGIGHDDIDTRHCFIAKRNPQINHQPLPGMTIKVQVHTDFT
jgi:hypothetical protein